MAGTTIWVTLSVFGLNFVLARYQWLGGLIRTAGACYLIYLGLRLMLSSKVAPSLAAVPAAPARSMLRAFRSGLLTNLSNPKTAAFFASLFVVMMPPDPPLAAQLAAIVLIVTISATWYGLVALTFSAGPAARIYRRGRRVIDVVSGGLFVAFGVKLFATR